jgi:hypothetical protein
LQTRKEFEGNPVVKEYFTIRGQLGKMEKALEESRSAESKVAVDQALITIYNKMTDPNSVVRESEYARTSTDQAVLNAIKGKAQKILEGGAGLTNVERDALVRMARLFGDVQQAMYDDHSEYYRAIAAGTGLNPDHGVKPDQYNRRVPRGQGAFPSAPGAPQTAEDFFRKKGVR